MIVNLFRKIFPKRPKGQRCLGCEHYGDFDIPEDEKDESDRLNKCYLHINDDEYGGPWFHEDDWCKFWRKKQ